MVRINMNHEQAFEHYLNNQYQLSIAGVMQLCANDNAADEFLRLAISYRRSIPSGARLV